MARKFVLITFLAILLVPMTAFADDDDDNDHRLQAVPFAFVGTAEEYGGPAGSNIVTAAWLGGMGLPDNGSNNSDPHLGLRLSKNGETPNCLSAGAEIKRFKKQTITELGFDFRKGGHCNNGAPRFNLTSNDGWTYFVGCSFGVHTPAPQNPQWEQVRFRNTDVFPADPQNAPTFMFGVTKVQSILIIHDEGADTGSAEDPNGVGLAVLDNIDINGKLITRGSGIEDGIDRDKGKDKDNDKHDKDDD